jgi:GT2 family glycosyltransferase
MARLATWWGCAYSENKVFDPRYTMTGNEDEFQDRLLKQGKSIGFSNGSYVFHYRSVSRESGLIGNSGKGAYRP